MDWIDALQIVIARTGVLRYEWLCSPENPDPWTREGYRALMVRLASGQPDPPPTPEDLALRAELVRHGCCG